MDRFGLMDRSAIESAVLVIVLVGAVILGMWFEPDRLSRGRVPGTTHIIKEERLRFRFSLRALLIVATLVAVLLGLAVWALR
jgi:hypothetical protein